MKSRKTKAFFVRERFLLPPLFGLFVFGRAAEAQQETIQPLAPPVESISELNMTNDFQVFAPQPAASAPMPYEPFRWDQFVFRPHADYQFMDAQGILAAPGDRENTTIQQITPGILINLGPDWSLDYTATIGLYSNTNFGTEFDHSITLTGLTVYTDWIFEFLQGVVLSSSPLIETGGPTSEQTYTTAVTGHHEDSQYISEDLGVYQSIQDVGGYEDMRGWSTIDWLNYAPQSHFDVGIGPGLGYNNADFGPDSFFEQLQARLDWRATDKLSFQLNGGIQETEFIGSEAAGNIFSPIYGGTIQYSPFAETQISAYANESLSPSVFVGEYTKNTSFGCTFSQRFFGQFYVNLNGTYGDADYVASAQDVLANRTDHLYGFTVRLSHAVLERGTASIFYEYSTDRSTFAGYTFTSNQYGAEINYSF